MEKNKIKNALEKIPPTNPWGKKKTFTRKLAKLKTGKIKKGENSEKELVTLRKTETNAWKIPKQVKKRKNTIKLTKIYWNYYWKLFLLKLLKN